MLRIVCIAAVLLASREIAAARVVMRPSVAASCPGSKTWDATQRCVARFGTVKVVRSQKDLRLVQLKSAEGRFDLSGYYLYVLHGKEWRIGGQIVGEESKLVKLEAVTIERKRLYRIDHVFAREEEVMVDDETARSAKVRGKLSSFCAGDSAVCSTVMTSCDVFVSGKLLWTFRGTLDHDKAGMMHVKGDRSRAGQFCAQDEEVFIPVPEIDFE